MRRKHSWRPSVGIALTVLFLANTSAHADLLSWSYNWEPSSTKIAANAGGSGYLSLTDEPANSASGSSNTVVTNLRTVSTASSSTPDSFNHANVSYTLQLTDSASKKTGSVTFSGYFSGLITGNSANVQLTITSPHTQSLSLGGNTYQVVLGTYTNPGPPGASNAGSLNAVVTATPGNGGGVVSAVPEPSTALLAGLALPCLGWVRWRGRRRMKDTLYSK